jgi:phosphatidate cytidylyltransferase
MWEFLGLYFPGSPRLKVFGLFSGVFLLLVLALPRTPPPALILGVMGILILGFFTFRYQGEPQTARELGLFFTGHLYLPPLLALAFGVYQGHQGPLFILFVSAVVFAGDTLAFYGGRLLGKRPFAPRISPKKTWEGAFASLAGSLLAVIPFKLYFPHLPLAPTLALALGLNILAQAGDLAESFLKRAAGAKDSGSLLPGHGGILDRIDGFLFAQPLLFIYQMLAGALVP